ncbi:MAG: LiaI-LiaF-like domain-containing protein [Candidatus Saccharicenans sp.]
MEEKIKIEPKKSTKSPALAAILSFFPGVGSMYNGLFLKGIIQLIIFAGLIEAQSHGGGQPFLGILLAGYIFYAIFDAAHDAQKINAGLQTAETQDGTTVKVEAEVEIEKPSGSISWGLILIGLGIIFLLANFEVISYDSLVKFWPLAVLLLGLKLIIDHFASKKS